MPGEKQEILRMTNRPDHLEDRLSLETIIALQRLLANGIPEEAPCEPATELEGNDVPEAAPASNELPGLVLQNSVAVDGGNPFSVIASLKRIKQDAAGFASPVIRRLRLVAERLGKNSGQDASVKKAA
jgi:hypothetical protein